MHIVNCFAIVAVLFDVYVVCYLEVEESVQISSRPTSKFMLAVDVVRRYMHKLNFGFFDGAVYAKAPEAEFTFVYCCAVKDFLLNILGNAEIADQIATFIPPLTNLLSQPSCKLIRPLVIDHNYIETLPKGTCFNIEKKVFESYPSDLEGSPRAFVKYECSDEAKKFSVNELGPT